MEPIHEETYKGYLIEIHLDDEPFDPRKDYDNLGTIATWHRRYMLGDVQPKEDMDVYIAQLVGEYWKDIEANNADYRRWAKKQEEDDSVETWLDELEDTEMPKLFSKYYVWLPVFMYDHSGISISTGRSYPYNCPWDSGQLGFIYISKQKYLKEMQAKQWSKELEQKAIAQLQAEIETYNDCLTGNVFGYCVWSLDNEEEKLEQIDSCWNFFPLDNRYPSYSYCLQEAKYYVDFLVKEKTNIEWNNYSKECNNLGE